MRGVGPAPCLARLDELGEVGGRADLEEAAELHGGVLRHQLDGVDLVAGLEDEDATQLLLGLGVGAVRGRDLAVSPVDGQGGLGRPAV